MNQILEKYPDEDEVFAIDLRRRLAAGVTLTGTPEVSVSTAMPGGTAVVVASPTVNTAPLALGGGQPASAGTVVLMRLSGGEPQVRAGYRDYVVTAKVQTSAGQTLVEACPLRVLKAAA